MIPSKLLFSTKCFVKIILDVAENFYSIACGILIRMILKSVEEVQSFLLNQRLKQNLKRCPKCKAKVKVYNIADEKTVLCKNGQVTFFVNYVFFLHYIFSVHGQFVWLVPQDKWRRIQKITTMIMLKIQSKVTRRTRPELVSSYSHRRRIWGFFIIYCRRLSAVSSIEVYCTAISRTNLCIKLWYSTVQYSTDYSTKTTSPAMLRWHRFLPSLDARSRGLPLICVPEPYYQRGNRRRHVSHMCPLILSYSS